MIAGEDTGSGGRWKCPSFKRRIFPFQHLSGRSPSLRSGLAAGGTWHSEGRALLAASRALFGGGKVGRIVCIYRAVYIYILWETYS